jgi:hypothetical protein
MTPDGRDNTDDPIVQTRYAFILIVFIRVHC